MSDKSAMPWSFHNPVKLEFGDGCLSRALAKTPYRRILFITSPGMVRRGTADQILSILDGREVDVCDAVVPNPEMTALDSLAEQYRGMKPFDGVIAMGGGSAIDTAKIIAAMLGMPGDFSLRGYFLEDRPVPDQCSPIPMVAIPTTAGTGSEVTPFATVWDKKGNRKYSLAGSFMFPEKAILDPETTSNLPWDTTLYSGLDALCQAFESIWNRNANPLTLGHAMHAALLAWRSLHQGDAILEQKALRRDMLEASLFAGLAISHTRTGLCHAMSYPLTLHYGLPHGLACGFSMPSVLELNLPHDDGRFEILASALELKSPLEIINSLSDLLKRLKIKKILGNYGFTGSVPKEMIDQMIYPGRSNNNLAKVTHQDVKYILEKWKES